MFYDCFWKKEMKIKNPNKIEKIQNTIKNPHKQHRHSLSTCWSFMDISRTVSKNVRVCFIYGFKIKIKRQKKTKQKKQPKKNQKRKPRDHEIFHLILIK